MRIKHLVFILGILLLTNFTFADSDKTINIAIIADKASGVDKSPLVSLLEVELSQKDGINLLERAAIDKILEEQQLNAAGLLDRNTTIKIGKLLRADAFIILSMENQTQDTNDLIRVRVSETAHGLRLADFFEQSDKTNPKEAVEIIIKKIETVITKISQPDEKLIPVGIVDIHRVQLGEQYKMLERTLPVMLSVRLSLEPQIIMLEREDLKVLLDEKLRTEGLDSDFWNSAILIEGYLQPNDGQLEMHLNLKQSDGENKISFTVQVEPNEPSIAIAQATTEIIQRLQNSPPTVKWQSDLEAEEFYKQGQMLSAHSRFEEALAIFETAHALQPHNIYYTANLFTISWQMRNENENVRYNNSGRREKIPEPWVCPYSDEELAELASIFVYQIRDGVIKNQLTSDKIYRNNWPSSLGISIQDSFGYFSSSVSITSEKARLLNRENRKIWVETMEAAIKKNPTYINNRDIARMTWISSDDPNILIENLKKAYTRFVLSPELGGEIKSPEERDLIFKGAFDIRFDERAGKRTYLKDNYLLIQKRWQEYLTEITNASDPVVLLNNYIALCEVVNDANNNEMNKAKYYVNESLKIISQQLHNPEETIKFSLGTSLHILKNKMEHIHYTKAELVNIWSDFYKPLIEKKDTIALASCNPGYGPPNMAMMYSVAMFYSEDRLNGPFDSQEAVKQWYQLLEQAAEVIDSSDGAENIRVINALNNIRNSQTELRNKFSYLAVPQKKTHLSVKNLMTIKGSYINTAPSIHFFGQTRIQNEMLWIAQELHMEFSNHGIPSLKSNIILAGINLKQKKLKSLWEIELPLATRYNLTDLVISDKACYLSICNTGILEFPGSTIEGQEHINNLNIITQKDGLPSNSITSMAKKGDDFWLAYGYQNQESGLGLYNMKTKQWTTVFCSTKEGNLPFNLNSPYQLKNLTIPKEGKLLFILDNPINYSSLTIGNLEYLHGLWELNTVSQALQYLCPIEYSSDIINIPEDKLLILSSNLIEYEISSKKIKLIYGRLQPFMKSFSDHGLPVPDFNKDLINPEKTKVMPIRDINLSNSAIHNNKLWALFGRYQIIVIDLGKSFDDAQIIENNILDGEPVERFVSTPYGLIAIGEGTVGLIETEN